MNNGDSTIDDQLSGVKLGHRLLDLEKRQSDLRLVGNFHELHADDLDATDVDLVLQKAFHACADDGRVGDKAGLTRLRLLVKRKLRADASDDLEALVLDVPVRIFYRVTVGNSVLDSVVHDRGDGQRRAALVGHRRAFER